MESINAVERELDEVLKDLELNSQKLCDQLESHDANAHNNNNNNNNKKTEIPVYIKQNKGKENDILIFFKSNSISICF